MIFIKLKTLQAKYIDPNAALLIEEGVLNEDMSIAKPYIIEAFVVDKFLKELGKYVADIKERSKKYKEDHAETRIVVNVAK